ncbi:hypothetical protein V8E55_002988 [Tylopilus felleus]
MYAEVVWRLNTDPTKPPLLLGDVYRPDILGVIEKTIHLLRPRLRDLSDKIHTHPELSCHSKNITSHTVSMFFFFRPIQVTNGYQ